MTVDIMLPYYGDVGLMKVAVQSVLEQSSDDWILHVVDDGYPNPEVARWFAGITDSRVHYSRNETNLGANENYRRCLEMVEQDWFVMMGADDIMLPHYLSTVTDIIKNGPVDLAVVQPGVEVVDEHGRPVSGVIDRTKRLYAPRGSGRRRLRGEDLAVSLLRGNWLYFPSLVWRRSSLPDGGFRRGLDVVQDLALVLDVVASGGSLVVDDAVCFQYRRHRGSDSSWRALEGTRFAEERRFFDAVADEMVGRDWSRAARVSRRHMSSRLNAATLLPRAVGRRQWRGVRSLGRHVAGVRPD